MDAEYPPIRRIEIECRITTELTLAAGLVKELLPQYPLKARVAADFAH